MPRFLYGLDQGSVVTDLNGTVLPGRSCTVYNARTAGSVVTDLQDISGAATSSPTSDSRGRVAFFGPDNVSSVLYIDFGDGIRWAVPPLDPGQVAGAVAAASYIPLTQRGANNGVATLSSAGKIPTGQIPTLPYLTDPGGGAAGEFLGLNGSGVLDYLPAPVGGGGGGSGAATPSYVCVVISKDMPQTFKDAAAGLENYFQCTGTNDDAVIQSAIDRAAPLPAYNSTSPSGARQLGTVQLTGGAFIVGNPLKMRTGVHLRGVGNLTELRAVGLTDDGTGYPAATPAVIKQLDVGSHDMWISDLWIACNYAAGNNCHGICFSGPGGSANDSTYPDHGSDPSNQVHRVFINGVSGSAHGLWLTNNCRAGHYSSLWIRANNTNGYGVFADSTPDSVLTGCDISGCAYAYRIEGANWRLHGCKSFYNEGGFYIGSGRHALGICESQDDGVGFNLAGIKSVAAALNVDCARDDGIIIAGNRWAIAAFEVYQRSGGRFGTTARGLTFSGSRTDILMTGYIEQTNGGTITTPISGSLPTTRSWGRIADDSSGTLTTFG